MQPGFPPPQLPGPDNNGLAAHVELTRKGKKRIPTFETHSGGQPPLLRRLRVAPQPSNVVGYTPTVQPKTRASIYLCRYA
jgi:hypothetical protein